MGFNGFKDLRVYAAAYALALEVFKITRTFPADERFDLTSQIRRSSRSVAANIAEAWKRRTYPKSFINKLVESGGECAETGVWLDFSKDLGYMSDEVYQDLAKRNEEIAKMLHSMMSRREKFCPKS